MSRERKVQNPTLNRSRDGRYRYWAPEGSHPSQVSGLFKDDPTFEEFCEILRQQREEDYQQANEAIDAIIKEEEEAKQCSSSTPTPSPVTRTHIPSSG